MDHVQVRNCVGRLTLPQVEAIAVHIRMAEQEREIAECLARPGQRPVERRLGSVPVDRRWTPVHAARMTVYETGRPAASGTLAGLRPTSEADPGGGSLRPAASAAGTRPGHGIGTR